MISLSLVVCAFFFFSYENQNRNQHSPHRERHIERNNHRALQNIFITAPRMFRVIAHGETNVTVIHRERTPVPTWTEIIYYYKSNNSGQLLSKITDLELFRLARHQSITKRCETHLLAPRFGWSSLGQTPRKRACWNRIRRFCGRCSASRQKLLRCPHCHKHLRRFCQCYNSVATCTKIARCFEKTMAVTQLQEFNESFENSVPTSLCNTGADRD